MKPKNQNLQVLNIFDTCEAFKGTKTLEKKECIFIVTAKELKEGLNKVKSFIKVGGALPVLETVKIETQQGCIALTGSDLEDTIIYNIPAETKGMGAICVPFAVLSEYTKTIKEGNLLFNIDFEGNTLEIKRDNSIFKIANCVDVTDYADLPKMEYKELLKLPANYFLQGINRCLPFLGNDDTRPALSAISMETSKDTIKFIGTNAHVLSNYTIKNTESYEYNSTENFNFLLSRQIGTNLKTVLKNETGILKVFYASEYIKFTYQNLIVVSRLSLEKYPDWRLVVPKDLPNCLKVNRKELIEVVSRLMVVNKTTNTVKFNLNGICEVTAEDTEATQESKEFIKDFSYKGTDIEIGYNGKFMVDILKSITSEKIMLMSSVPNRASLILPMEVNRQSEYVTLLMPIELVNGVTEHTPKPEPEPEPEPETVTDKLE